MQRRFVLWAAEQLNGGETTSHHHVIAAVDLGNRGEVGSQVLLPGGLRLRVAYTEVTVERLTAAEPDRGYILLPVETEITVSVPGITLVSGSAWALVTRTTPPSADSLGTWAGLTGSSDLLLRTRREGDRFASPGLGGHTKKLNRWFTDQKVPNDLRDRIPLLVVGGQVAAIRLVDRWVVSTQFIPQEQAKPAVYAELQKIP
ncbi:MAG: tRNA lysidine(34) synthetase TilS [Anaerolineaceae bacterium]|nr:tRNA lysidine(34) synthetase TilS [Anaerolineaceae bacterium]